MTALFFPMSYIPDATVKIPEWEKQDLAQCIHNEFKFICQIKMAEIVTKVIPINLSIPTPLGFSIDVIELFKNKDYKAELIAKVTKNFEKYRKMLPSSMQEMWSEMGIVHDEMGVRKMMEWVIQTISGGLYALLMKAFKKAIKLVEDLGLSILGLKDLLSLDIESMFDKLIEAAKKKGDQWMEELEKTLTSLSIFGMTIEDIMGGAIEEKVQSTARRVSRIMENLRKFNIDYPIYMLEKWVEKVMSLLEKIGIKIPFIPFTFCDALTLIGMPKSISLPSGLEEVATLTTTTSDSMSISDPYSNVNSDGTPVV